MKLNQKMKYKVMENVSVRKGALLMKRMLSILIVAVMMLTVVSVPQMTNADARGIKVIPYPRTAGKMASYKISFNVTRALEANKDSITVTLPKETVVPDYISSSVISINPKKLIGTDFRLNFSTGGITFTNPLREGDMIKASYTYEASEDYTFMPKATDVKFFDRSFDTTDPRSNNGQFDPGEWVYEDRDHNGRISPGDRRLMVVKGVLGGIVTPPNYPPDGSDAKQNSIVAPGDWDCYQDLNMMSYLNPLAPLSLIRLTMMDLNNDGIYNEGDYLFDDRDQSGTISIGDNMVAGIASYPPGSIVAFNDPDYSTRTDGSSLPGVNFKSFNNTNAVYRHADDGSTTGSYDPGEAIYQEDGFDPTGTDVGTLSVQTYSVDAGDWRVSSVTLFVNGVMYFYPAGTRVTLGDFDIGRRLIDFKIATREEEAYLDVNVNSYYDMGEPMYRNGNSRAGFVGVDGLTGTENPKPGDIRLSYWSLSAYHPYSYVDTTHADANTSLVEFNRSPNQTPELMAVYNYSYNPPVTDILQAPRMMAINTSLQTYSGAAFHYVAPPATPLTWVSDRATVNTAFDTWLYRDNDLSGTITPGDTRLTIVEMVLGKDTVKYSAGSTVKTGELDAIPQSTSFGPLQLARPAIYPASNPLVSALTPSTNVLHAEGIKVNNTFDPGEYIYQDAGTTPGLVDGTGAPGSDIRLVPVGVTSFGNRPIQNGYPLIGQTLTRGWARIENKVIVPYAQAGMKTAALETTPITVLPTLIPPTPPSSLSATYFTLPGGNTPLTNSGTWYIRVSAVNMYGEGEPSEPMAITFPQNSTTNSVKLSWRPIPFAVSYRIYKSKNDAYFPPNSLLAEVEAPCTEYTDKGTTITEGGLPFPYKASFMTLWRTRGGMETELVEYNCADYEIDLATGMVRFRRALRPYEIVLADYKFAPSKTSLGADLDPCKTVGHKDEHVYVDTQRGVGKLLHAPAVDPKIDPLNYCFRLWRAPLIDPKNPYLLREGSDYTINYQTGDIQFSTHVVTEGDIITADYDTFEEVAGESLVEAISTGITQAQCSSPVIPESYTIYRAVALRSAPQIKVTGGAYGWQIVFTTPVDVSIDPDNDPETPDIVMTLNRPGKQLTATNKGAVRNPEKAGMYQLWVNTSQEQTPILSEAYEITADKDLGSVKLNIISPQGTASGDTIESVATAGQPISVVTQLMAGSNGLPNVYVKFEIVSTPQPQSAFASPSLVQTNDQGLASVVLNLSATAGTTVVKVYLQDKPSLSWTIRINTGPATSIAKIVVTPSNIALTPNSQQQFTAQAFDANGTVIPGASFTWAADKGVINPNGLYTAPTDTGIIDKVYARSSGKEGFATVQITQRPQRIEVTPQSAIIAAGSKQQYTAQPYDSYGNPMNVTVSWSVKAGTTGAVVGTIDGNGLFTANAGTTGDSVIEACCAGVCGTAKIIISDVTNTVEKVEINPKSLTMTIGGTYQFKAKAYDKNNNEIVNAKFEWAVNPKDNGNISTDGLFMPAKTGTMVVFVIAGGKQDVCLVTVTEPIARIDVIPNSVELEYGSQKTFTATAYTAQGAVIPNITFTWEVSPTSGFAVLSGTTATQATLTAIGSANTAGMLVAKVGNVQGFATVKIIDKKPLDTECPKVTLVNPVSSGSSVPASMQFNLEFKVEDVSGVSEVLVNGMAAIPGASGTYTKIINVVKGVNTVIIKAKDNSANKNTCDTNVIIIGTCPRTLVLTQGLKQGKLTQDCGGIAESLTLKSTVDNVGGSMFTGLRDLGETLFGGTVAYETATKTITITFAKSNGDAYTVVCIIGQTMAKISAIDSKGQPIQIPNSGYITLPQAPYIASKNVKKGLYYVQNNNNTMVPLRTLVEALYGKTVTINGQTLNTVDYDAVLKQATFRIIP